MGKVPKRPLTSGTPELNNSASLPSLLPSPGPAAPAVIVAGGARHGGGASPYAEDLRKEKELNALRKRNKELELELRSL